MHLALRDGKPVSAVKVENGAAEGRISGWSSGGHRFVHFGFFVNTE